jgi:hypothetical protein
MTIEGKPGAGWANLSGARLRSALHNVLRVIFDVERTRGKLREWYSTVEDPARVGAAQTLASVLRKIEFLNANAEALGPVSSALPLDRQAVASLSGRIAQIGGLPAASVAQQAGPLRRVKRGVRRILVTPFIFSRAVKADRFIEARLQSSSQDALLAKYRRLRKRLRSVVG